MLYETVIVGYIMFNNLVQDDNYEQSFYTQIEKANKIADCFMHHYPNNHKWRDEEQFEKSLRKFIRKNLN